ncbi:MAG: hypothetical protein Q9221_009168, partial [Calogaya cf. arnoldii]
MRQLLVMVATAASILPFSFATRATTTSQVDTTSGLIIGHQAPNKTDVTEFLGIKYAEAAVGELRFAAPKRYIALPGTVHNASEWVSERHLPEAAGFQIPGPHSPFYNGQYLSDSEDVVVVTPNYRLGVLGFFGAPGIQQNAALLDHRSVVEWVRDNIAGFGGDPSRIVIFGQSVGVSAVDYYSFAWKRDPIVSGLISHSGTLLSFNPNTVEYAQRIWYNVSQSIGCGGPNDDAAAVLACVRAVNVTTVLAAAAKVPALPTIALAQATFQPTIDNVTVFGDYEGLSASGAFAKIPYLVGNTDFEAGWYKLSAYGAKKNLSEAQWDLFNQRAFTCPSGYSAMFRVSNNVPTWRYRYHGDRENLRLYKGTAGLGPRGSGAYHGSDIEMVFGTGQDVSGLRNSVAENATSKYMMGAWAAFARDTKAGLEKYGGQLTVRM